jgi:uncharacterized membrane protein YdbT with pleckstrin-like domain
MMPAQQLQQEAQLIYEGKGSWRNEIGWTLLGVVLVPVVVGVVMLLAGWIRRASTKYRITSRRIEWEEGLFSRRIDGVDLWRVRHVNYLQTLTDRIFGVSRLEVFSQDREDPHAVIPGIPASRVVYDQVTAAVQNARQGSVGIVQ